MEGVPGNVFKEASFLQGQVWSPFSAFAPRGAPAGCRQHSRVWHQEGHPCVSDIAILSLSALGGRSGTYFLGWPIIANMIIWRELFVTPKALYRPWLQAQHIV